MKKSVLTLVFICIAFLCTAQTTVLIPDFDFELGESVFTIAPQTRTGSHVNSIGLALSVKGHLDKIWSDSSAVGVQLEAFSINSAVLEYFGLPGESFQSHNGLSLGLGFGPEINRFNDIIRQHLISYSGGYIFSTDGTSQPYGRLGYSFSAHNFDITFFLDNDDMYALLTDKYRTTSGELGFNLYDAEDRVGAALGFRLWTGKLDGSESGTNSERRYNTYTLEGHGGDYSHGIAYVAFKYNNICLKLGYDDESIRDFIQNGWHWIYNRPAVPLVENRPARFYIELEFNMTGFEY